MKKAMVLILALALMLAVPAMAATEAVTLTSRGAQIPAIVTLPDGARGDYPFVVMAHGHGGSKDENVGFGAIADQLAARGIASIRMDFPGCGESQESFQLNNMTNMKQDVLAGVDYMVKNYPVDRDDAGIFGYSMGGRIALELLAEKAYDFEAVALLAPAADNADMKNLFGGAEAYDAMRAEAEQNGFVVFTTIYGQVQELGKQWFDDLAAYDDLAAVAARAFDEDDVLVIYAQEDEAVSPSVSKHVADVMGAKVVDASGDGHSYGFYSDKTDVLDKVASSVANFFADELD